MTTPPPNHPGLAEWEIDLLESFRAETLTTLLNDWIETPLDSYCMSGRRIYDELMATFDHDWSFYA